MDAKRAIELIRRQGWRHTVDEVVLLATEPAALEGEDRRRRLHLVAQLKDMEFRRERALFLARQAVVLAVSVYLGCQLEAARPASPWLWEYVGRDAVAALNVAAYSWFLWFTAFAVRYYRPL